MPPALLYILFALLLSSLALGTLALLRSGSERTLRERVRAIGASRPAARTELPSIRMELSNRSTLSAWLLRLLRYDPDMPLCYTIPWPLVAMLGLLAGVATVWAFGGMLGEVAGLAAGLAGGLFTARIVFAWQRGRHIEKLFEQIPDALAQISRSLRAGLPLTEAIRGISRESVSPTREEFARVMGEVAIGRALDAALERLHARTGLREYAFLAVTLSLQSQTGGSLAETLDNLADLVRQRVRMAKRVSALAGEAKAQAAVLVVMPFLAGAAMSVLQPFYIAALTEDPLGRRMVAIGLGLMLLGLLTIRWLIRRTQQG